MGRRRSTVSAQTVRELDEVAERNAEIADNESETIERIQAALGDGGTDSIWLIRVNQVVKEPDGTITEGWMFNANITEMETLRERIAAECGPGRYRCRVQKDSKPFKQYDLVIMLPLAQRRAAALPAAQAPAAQAPAPASDISPAVLRILENQNRMIEAIANRPAGPTMTDILSQMKMMKELMPEAPAPMAGFEMFTKALDLARNILGDRPSGGKETGAGVLDLARDLIPKLPEILNAARPLQGQPAPAPAAMLANPQPVPQQPHQPAPLMQAPAGEATPQQKMEQANKLKAYLLDAAAKGTDPAMCVDFAMENMPPELDQALLEAENPLDLVMQVIPEAVPYRAWFSRLLDELFAPDEPEAALTPAPGNGLPPARPN
jgi:hypothetical protein